MARGDQGRVGDQRDLRSELADLRTRKV